VTQIVRSKLHLKTIRVVCPACQRYHTRIVLSGDQGLPAVHPLREVGRSDAKVGQIEMS